MFERSDGPDAVDADIWHALMQANFRKFVESLPDVGQMGPMETTGNLLMSRDGALFHWLFCVGSKGHAKQRQDRDCRQKHDEQLNRP
jgi:hypothetical protein